MLHVKKTIHLKENQTLWIAPFNDIHYNTEECDKERFHRYIQWGERKLKDGDLLAGIGLGDYNDFQSPSERASDNSANRGFGKHETTLKEYDKLVEKLTLEFAKVMSPWRGHIIGLQEGHHYGCYSAFFRKTYRGASNTEHLADLLSTTYVGQLGLYHLDLGHGLEFRILGAHGYGGARTPGARVIKRVAMNQVFEANLYLMAHDNTKMAISDNCLIYDKDNNYVTKKRTYCGTGSFQRAYPPDTPSGGYVEALLLPPSDLGAVITSIRKEKRNGKYRLDWHTSV
jgi:hypothetical protein